MSMAVQAGLWGLLGSSALLLGALAAWFTAIPNRVIAGVMAFGSGVVISALSFELMEEAVRRGGFGATSAGFLGGAATYTAANVALSRWAPSTASALAPSKGTRAAEAWPSRSVRCWTAIRRP